MFAVAKSAGNGVTVDQSGAVLDKWSPPHHVVSDDVAIGYQLDVIFYYVEVP